MRIRGIAASLLALAIAVAVPVAVASPALAGADPAVVSWTYVAGSTPSCPASTGTVLANPGSQITLHNNCLVTQPFTISQPGGAVFASVSIPFPGQATVTLPRVLGDYTITPRIGGASVKLTITNDPINRLAHDEFQQVGVPASGDCANVAPETGHYPGYPIGGWSKSWAQWIYGGTGGPVCTREVEERPDGAIVLIG